MSAKVDWSEVTVPVPALVWTGRLSGTLTPLGLGLAIFTTFQIGLVDVPAGPWKVKMLAVIAASPLIAGVIVSQLIGHPRLTAVYAIHGGFRMIRKGFQRDVLYSTIRRMTLSYTTHATNSGVTHTARLNLDMEGGAPPLTLFGPSYSYGQVDPIAWLAVEVQESLVARAAEALSHGETLQADGWTLSQESLSIRKPRLIVSLAEINSVGIADNQFCIWRRGEPRPIASLSGVGPNIPVLHALLKQRMTGDPEPVISDNYHGRVFFERRSSFRSFAVIAAIAFASFALGVILSQNARLAIYPGGLAIGCLILAVLGRKIGWTFSEGGAEQRPLFGAGRLLYIDAGELTHKETNYYQLGRVRSTTIAFTIAPEIGHPGQRIRFTSATGNRDLALVQVSDCVTKVIADRMRTELRASGTAYWTMKIQFERTGLGIKKRSIAYEDIIKCELAGGMLTIELAAGKPIKIPASAPNFWPGYVLLQEFLATPRSRKHCRNFST